MFNFHKQITWPISTYESNTNTFSKHTPEASPVLTLGKYSRGQVQTITPPALHGMFWFVMKCLEISSEPSFQLFNYFKVNWLVLENSYVFQYQHNNPAVENQRILQISGNSCSYAIVCGCVCMFQVILYIVIDSHS